MTPRRRFTPEYRQKVARLVIDTGHTIVSVAKEQGIHPNTLGRWVKEERERTGQNIDPTVKISTVERQEIIRLRKENAELKLNNEILEKAAILFASKRQKLSTTSA